MRDCVLDSLKNMYYTVYNKLSTAPEITLNKQIQLYIPLH